MGKSSHVSHLARKFSSKDKVTQEFFYESCPRISSHNTVRLLVLGVFLNTIQNICHYNNPKPTSYILKLERKAYKMNVLCILHHNVQCKWKEVIQNATYKMRLGETFKRKWLTAQIDFPQEYKKVPAFTLKIGLAGTIAGSILCCVSLLFSKKRMHLHRYWYMDGVPTEPAQ